MDEIKYIVFASSLMELFKQCASCYNECTGEIAYQKGTFVAVRQHCMHCGYQRMWRSQPHIKDTPAGNILLSAAILFSGATPGKILQMLAHMRVASISNRTFYYHQSQYLQPAVLSVWKTKQQKLLAQCRSLGTPLSVGGDGRADSPGHSAKYGSYGIIDLTINKVIHVELVQVSQNQWSWNSSIIFFEQSNEVKSSNHMEKEGLSRALQFLADKHVTVATLITDRHKQVSKFVCNKYPHIKHHYDVWHVAKGTLLIYYVVDLHLTYILMKV